MSDIDIPTRPALSTTEIRYERDGATAFYYFQIMVWEKVTEWDYEPVWFLGVMLPSNPHPVEQWVSKGKFSLLKDAEDAVRVMKHPIKCTHQNEEISE